MLDNARIRRFHAALNAANLMSQKYNLISGYGVESTKDLTAEQADELIARLNQISDNRKKEIEPEIRKARSVVMTVLNQIGVYVHNGNWSHVNRFLLKPQIAGKMLYEMDLNELQKLQGKLRKIARDKDKKRQEGKYLATNN